MAYGPGLVIKQHCTRLMSLGKYCLSSCCQCTACFNYATDWPVGYVDPIALADLEACLRGALMQFLIQGMIQGMGSR